MGGSNDENFFRSELEFFRKQPIVFKIAIISFIILTFVVFIGIFIAALVIGPFEDIRDGIWAIIGIAIVYIVYGILFIVGRILIKGNGKQHERRQQRKRRKQIREAGLDQLDDGEQAISPEEFEERYNQRQAQRQAIAQNRGRRRPVIAILNERPSNETLLKKMIFKGKITGEKCSICKLALRKKQTIVQCAKCHALFHYDHLNNWFEKNNDCPVCDELLVE